MASKIIQIKNNFFKYNNNNVNLFKQLQLASILTNKTTEREFLNFSNISNKSKHYTEKKLVGFSMDQMFAVVSDVEHYYQFVPFCKKSNVYSRQPGFLRADLIIGFPPLNESYTSHVTLQKPNLIKAECRDGKLFNYLLNYWRFSPGLKDIPQSSVIDFKVEFDFKSVIHSNFANIFFDQIVIKMEQAFIDEAVRRYGQPTLRSHIISSHSDKT